MDCVKKMRVSIIFGAAVMLLTACATGGGKTAAPEQNVSAPVTEAVNTRSSMEQQYGIQIDSVHLTAANYMMSFKFKVLDVEKATPLMSRKIDPYVVHEKSGSKFAVPVSPKIGAIRSTPKFAQEGKNYFIFFGNPSGYVKSGDRITIVIGDFKQEHVEVL